MKFILCFLLSVICSSAFAINDMISRPTPTLPIVLDTSSTNVTSGAWVTFAAAASMPYACSAVLIHNSGSQPIKIGIGAAASETELGLVFPIGVSAFVPVRLAKGVRVAVRSMGSTQSSGILTMSCFQ